MTSGSLAEWNRRLSKACGGDAVSRRVARAIGEALTAVHGVQGDWWAVSLTPQKLSIVVGTVPVLEATGRSIRFYGSSDAAGDLERMRVRVEVGPSTLPGFTRAQVISVQSADFPRVFANASIRDSFLAVVRKATKSGPIGRDVYVRNALWALRRLTGMSLPDPHPWDDGPPEPKRRARSASRAKPAPVGVAEDGSPVLALSIRQPYAEEIMRGVKTVEYRSRPTNVRGRVHIYASLARPAADEPEDALPRGVIVGTVEIVDSTGDGDSFEWHLAKPRRAPKLVRPAKHPQPVFFKPF